MDDSLFWGIPQGAYESAERMITLARKGGIRQHLLGDTSRIRHGSIEDQSVDDYCNFLQTKLCCEIMQLDGEGVPGADGAASGELSAAVAAASGEAAVTQADATSEKMPGGAPITQADATMAEADRDEEIKGGNA